MRLELTAVFHEAEEGGYVAFVRQSPVRSRRVTRSMRHAQS